MAKITAAFAATFAWIDANPRKGALAGFGAAFVVAWVIRGLF